MAQGIADAGADIIIGTNPGVLQPVEILTSTRGDGAQRQTLCAYSLGSILNSNRADRSVISSALLHMNLKYNLHNRWRSPLRALPIRRYTSGVGKYEGRTAFQPMISNAGPPPYMDEDQRAVMGRSLNDVRAVFGKLFDSGTVIQMSVKNRSFYSGLLHAIDGVIEGYRKRTQHENPLCGCCSRNYPGAGITDQRVGNGLSASS